MTTITVGSATDPGQRENNEDSLIAVTAQDPGSAAEASRPMAGASALMILADGMGGRARGQVASRTAVKIVYRELAHILAMRSESDAAYLENSLHNAMRQANARIQEIVASNADSEGMGTTCTVGLISRGMLAIAHVGDSRAYLLPASGHAIERLTEDHSVVAGEVKAGRLTVDEARRSKFRNVITRAVGVEENLSPDFLTREVDFGVTYLILSSDGMHGSVKDDEIGTIVRAAGSPQDAADNLIREALARGAKDNVSVVVARIEYDAPAGGAPRMRSGVRRTDRRRTRITANAAAFTLGIVIAAASAWVAISQFTQTRFVPMPIPVKTAAKTAPQAIDPTKANYAAPEPLLGRAVLGSVLIAAPNSLLVIDPATKQVLRVDPNTGNIITVVPDSAHLGANSLLGSHWAADTEGELYESQTSPPMIRKFGPDGTFLRTVGQGVLSAPGAISVTANGDIFVVDAGTLKRMRAVATGAPGTSLLHAATVNPTGEASPNAGAPTPHSYP